MLIRAARNSKFRILSGGVMTVDRKKTKFLGKGTNPWGRGSASRLGHRSTGKNSVRNLQYGPRTRLVRGIYYK